MKTLVITLVLSFSFTTTLFSQNFGLVGTEWYYGIKDQSCNSVCDYVHLKSVKDTIIQGETTFKIIQTYIRDVGDTLYLDPLYVYNQADTTFTYSFVELKFLKLFIFNGNQGDTLTLDYTSIFSGTSSTYRLLIDTVIQKSINGVPLKEYQTTALDGVQFYSEHGSFMDRIGGLDWIFPRQAIIPENVGPVRCYKDAQIDTSFTANACDLLWITAVPEMENNASFKLYPNPSSNNLVVVNLGQQKSAVVIELRTIDGKLALTQKASNFEKVIVNTAEIPAGIYFVTVKDNAKTITTQKWVKME